MGRFALTTNALDRLAAAEELLVELRAARLEPNRFRHKANEFVAALRSVPAMLQGDSGTRPGFKAWWRSSDPGVVAEIAKIKALRDRALKDRVLTQADYGDSEAALARFKAQIDFMRILVRDCMSRFEGKG